jgi:hypothetical protein
MQSVIALVDARRAEFGRRPLFTLLADRSIAPETRLAFVPHMAHFVMGFADLCNFILPESPPRDGFAELVNAHAAEDRDHWPWYLHDLEQLGHDRPQPFGDALRFLYGEETRRTRLLTYRLCQLAMGATPLQKLVLILVMEAAARLGFERTTAAARELRGRELTYFGGQHLETEGQHAIVVHPVQRALEGVVLDEDARGALREVVNQAFDAFIAMVDGLFDVVQKTRGATDERDDPQLHVVE